MAYGYSICVHQSLPLLSNPFAPPFIRNSFAPPIHTFIALPLIPPLLPLLHPYCLSPFVLSSPPPLPCPSPRPLSPSPRMSAADLAGLVSRLETVTTRLETVAARGGGGGGGGEWGRGGGRGRGVMEGECMCEEGGSVTGWVRGR